MVGGSLDMPDKVGFLSLNQNPIRILRLPDVILRVGLKRAAIYQRIMQGVFPKQISLGGRAVGWLAHEIDAWLAARIAARGRVISESV